MILDAAQDFQLLHPQGQAAALDFVRHPEVALAEVRFLRGLTANDGQVCGELVVQVPMLGEVDLPFCSALHETANGAELHPLALSGQRAWVEVAGQASASAEGTMDFAFQFRAHLATPEAEGWGGAAFEKMVQAAARRTLERVARALPQGLAASLPPQT